MKFILTLLTFFLLANYSTSQTKFPDFLLGTWKMEGKDSYEHWDNANTNTLKGFSYQLKNGQMIVSEYLEVSRKGKKIVYTATVLQQNQGKDVPFRLTRSDSAYIFENPSHDFPKKIVYQPINSTEILVRVSDGQQKGFSYKMQKQDAPPAERDSINANPAYDPALAQKLGGDDYGMKAFILVLLKTGPNTTTDKAFINESFRGHLDNINRLVAAGKLIVAGPLGKNNNSYRGIFILNNVPSLDEAKELLQTDPAIKAGLLDADLYTWYGSSALPEYLPFSEKVWRLKP